ncbi:MAG: LuxR C-terminal-related transcriptional regulator [Actinomycetota bacterium]
MRERRHDTRLVGRRRELARLRELADDPATGAVLLTGPTGVGKSRLAEGAMVDLTTRGWHGVGLSATDPASRIPFGALSELIPDALDRLDDVDPDRAELTVLRAVETALRLRDGDPVAVVIDDVAGVDRPTCDLLVHLAANRRLFLIANQGPDGDVGDAMRRLTPAGVTELAVEPLSAAATAELATEVLGGPVGPGLVRNLDERAKGSPLFIRELLASARSNGRVTEIDGVNHLTGELTVGPSLGRQIVFRFGLLSQAEQDVLELLALARELGVEDLAEIADPAVLETMERRGLITTTLRGRRLRAGLGHPLQGEAIEAGLTPLTQRRRNRELAELLARRGGRRAEDRVVGAVTRLAAGQELDLDEQIEAVGIALRIDRIREGAELARSAHARESSERTRTALAETLIRLGRFVEADGLLAEPIADDAGEWERLRRAIRRSSNRLWGFRDPAGALAIDDACLATLTEPAATDRVVAHQAWIDYCDGRPTDALDRIAHLPDDADDIDPDVRFAVAAVRAPALVLVGAVDDAADLATRAWEGGWGADTPYGSHGQHLIALGFATLHQGDVEAARFVAGAAIEHCRASSETTALLFFLDLAANIELLAGDLPAAVSYLDEALDIGRDLAIATSVRSSLATAKAQLGQTDEARRQLDRLDRVPPAPSPRGQAEQRSAEAWTVASSGDGAGGADILRLAADEARSAGLRIHQLFALLDRARLGYADADDATAATAAAEHAQGRLAPTLARAVAACVTNRGDDLDRAAAGLGDLGFRLWSAELSARAADAWASAGEPRAATASQRASEQERARLPAARTPSLARAPSVEPLTRREREIAAIAAAGSSNNDIAERLHVSVRTVETHLNRIYRKLGITNRTDLAKALDPTATPS